MNIIISAFLVLVQGIILSTALYALEGAKSLAPNELTIKLNEADFLLIFNAFFAEIERKYS